MSHPVVLLHAFPLNHRLWDAQRAALESAGYAVLAPDLPGFGSAPLPPAEPSIDAYATAVWNIVDRAGYDQVVLGGLSLGGYVALAMLRSAPERVTALILADTRATADSAEAALNRLAVAEQVESAGTTAALARAMMPNLLGESTHSHRPDVIDTVKEWIEQNGVEGVAWAQRAMAARADSVGLLASFTGPTLVLWGEEDTLTGYADQEVMIDAIDDLEFAAIPAAGHLSSIENPTAVTGVLLDFVAAVTEQE